MTKPFLSIIIPLYNKENFIAKTLSSVFNQTFQDFEVIIVEDCSTDNSKMIAENLLNNKCKIIQHEKNKNLSASRNTGIRNANADYLVFLDADDILKPNYLEKIVFLINNFPEASIFATNYEECFKKNKPLKTLINLDEKNNDFIVEDFFKANLKQPIYCQSSFCAKKIAFDKIGFYNEKITYSEDVDFNIRANYYLKLAYSKTILVEVTKHDVNQITNNSVLGKIVPNLDSFEILAQNNPNLKKYLDLHRYMFANLFKRANDNYNFNKLKNGISKNPKISGLNLKQRLLLRMPNYILRLLALIKKELLKKGISISGF